MMSGMRSALQSALSSNLNFDSNNELIKAYLDKKVAQNKLNYQNVLDTFNFNYEKLLQNQQPIIMEETMQFLNREFDKL